MTESRDAKRVRLACLNCRRKKTRCSGERPTCAFCARLNQTCRYQDDITTTSNVAPSADAAHAAMQQENSNLAARIALLESKLSLMDASSLTTVPFFTSPSVPTTNPISSSGGSVEGYSPQNSHSAPDELFSTLPDITILRSLTDVYFKACHGQPYSYFHEESFRKGLEEGTHPNYLLCAFITTAVRFSDDPFWGGQQIRAMDEYSKTAWSAIVDFTFSDSHNLNLRMVQATNMLGLSEYVAGRSQSGWVKAGLSIRFAQTLRLGQECTQNITDAEREERRSTFWSIYLLDRFASCGRDRPPTILDSECGIRLPSSEDCFRHGTFDESPTLAAMNEIPNTTLANKLDPFTLTAFMGSVLGCALRWCFQSTTLEMHLPWDTRSEYARVNGVLLSFESYADTNRSALDVVFDRDYGVNSSCNRGTICHFLYSHILYHVNQCLLNHPFLLRQRVKSCNAKTPPSFLAAAVRKSREHAAALTALFVTLQQRGSKIYPSFYGYAATLAGSIHRLHSRNEQSPDADKAEADWKATVEFLDQKPAHWISFRRMSYALKEFDPSPALCEELLSCTLSYKYLDADAEERLWQISDYSWLTDSKRPIAPPGDDVPLSTETSTTTNPWAQFPDINTYFNGLSPASMPFDFLDPSMTR